MSKKATTNPNNGVAPEGEASKDQPKPPRPQVIDWVVADMRRGLATKN